MQFHVTTNRKIGPNILHSLEHLYSKASLGLAVVIERVLLELVRFGLIPRHIRGLGFLESGQRTALGQAFGEANLLKKCIPLDACHQLG